MIFLAISSLIATRASLTLTITFPPSDDTILTVPPRLGSLEPRTITEEFCKRASKLPYLCPHFHLSMQSGCDATLKRMNRKYDTARYMESCDLLRQYFDDPAITTDLITGFPEETEEEFAQTLDFIARVGFADMHVFPYSIRPRRRQMRREKLQLVAVHCFCGDKVVF